MHNRFNLFWKMYKLVNSEISWNIKRTKDQRYYNIKRIWGEEYCWVIDLFNETETLRIHKRSNLQRIYRPDCLY